MGRTNSPDQPPILAAGVKWRGMHTKIVTVRRGNLNLWRYVEPKTEQVIPMVHPENQKLLTTTGRAKGTACRVTATFIYWAHAI